MAIVRKIAYNAFFITTYKILSIAVALASIGFITRYLGKDGFGDYATVLAFFSLFGSVADLGIYSVATREISRTGADEKKIISNVFAFRVLSALAVFLICPLVIFIFPYSPEVKTGIVIAAASFVFSSSYMVLNGIFQKYLVMNKVALVELFGKIIQLAIIVLAIKKDLGFTVIIGSVLAAMAFNFLFVFFFSRRYISFGFKFDFYYWKKFIRESLPMGISVIITFLYFKTDTIILSLIKGSADVGIYNVAYKVIENITFFPAMIVGLTLPLTSRFIFSEQEKFHQLSDKTFKLFLVLSVPLVVGTIFLSDGVVRLIGGGGFSEAGNVLRILIFALFFIFFGNLFNNILLAGNLQKKMMVALFFCAVFNISLNLFLIPIYSYNGAAITSVLTEFLVAIITYYLIKKNLNYFPKTESWWKILSSGIIMAVFFYIFKNQGFFILSFIGILSYFLSLWLIRAVSIGELKSIFSRHQNEIYLDEKIQSP